VFRRESFRPTAVSTRQQLRGHTAERDARAGTAPAGLHAKQCAETPTTMQILVLDQQRTTDHTRVEVHRTHRHLTLMALENTPHFPARRSRVPIHALELSISATVSSTAAATPTSASCAVLPTAPTTYTQCTTTTTTTTTGYPISAPSFTSLLGAYASLASMIAVYFH
jgi:hypothetical protein